MQPTNEISIKNLNKYGSWLKTRKKSNTNFFRLIGFVEYFSVRSLEAS
jgi:hypothetical protein